MFEGAPKEFFHHVAITFFVGIGERVSVGENGVLYRLELAGVVPQCVAHIVESDGVGHLRKKQAHDMAPFAKYSHFFVHPVLLRQLIDECFWDQIAQLA